MKVEKLAKNGEKVQNCYPLSPGDDAGGAEEDPDARTERKQRIAGSLSKPRVTTRFDIRDQRLE